MDIPYITQLCAQDIDHVITRACNEALNFVRDESRFIAPYMVLQDISDRILALVRISIEAFARRQNERSLVLTVLPSEILGLIAGYLSMEDCISVTHVCQKLRHTLLSGNPLLWNEITLSNTNGKLTALLERSASADIQLSGRVTQSNWMEVSRCLQSHIHRCTSLKLILLELPLEGRVAITRSLCNPAPRLHTFRLLDSLQQFNSDFDANNRLFAGDAPNLTLMKAYMNISALVPAGSSFSGLKKLLFSPANSGASMADISAALERFPNLNALVIELDDWSNDGQQDNKVPLPDSLALFNVISNSQQVDPVSVFSRIVQNQNYSEDSERRNLVSYNIPPTAEAVRALLTARPPPGHTLDYLTLSTLTRPSDVFTTHYLKRAASPLADDVAPFTNLTVLSMSEDEFLLARPFPPAPALQYLSIRIECCPEGPAWAHETVFLLSGDEARASAPFECPSLLQLTLFSSDNRRILSLDPALVREFVEGQLRLGRDTLPVLQLRQTRLLENDVEEIARLMARVETVSVWDQSTGSSGDASDDSSDEVWSTIPTLRYWN